MKESLVVGAGLWGCVIARRLADAGRLVTICDSRNAIGGNSASFIDTETGIEVHSYGSHIFHTDDESVLGYISRFCRLNGYKHGVMSMHKGVAYQMPIGLSLLNSYFGESLTPADAEDFVSRKEVRRAIFDAFFRGYTRKQWGTDDVDESIIGRIPFRCNYDTNYFKTIIQGIPDCGYGEMFSRILRHDNISVELGRKVGIDEITRHGADVYYSGPLDELFGYVHGDLDWRTIDLDTVVVGTTDYQGIAVMNYPDEDVPYTRIHEYKHYHPEWRGAYEIGRTVIQYETPRGCVRGDVPFYPVRNDETAQLQAKYEAEARKVRNLRTGGRLGGFRYIDMAQAIREALDLKIEGVK